MKGNAETKYRTGNVNITPEDIGIKVDSALSSSSTNPVQNKVVNTALDGKAYIGYYGNTSMKLGGGYVSANGSYSAAIGRYNEANKDYSQAFGMKNISNNFAAMVIGKYANTSSQNGLSNNTIGHAFVVGNGYGNDNSTTVASNALRVTYNGYTYGANAFNSSGADYAEFVKEWADGNIEDEDRVGYFVTVKDGFLHKAEEGDYIYGITSGNPSVVGNSDEDYYWKYERDEFNRIVMEDTAEIIHKKDEEGNPLYDEDGSPVMEKTGNIIKNSRMKISENYNPLLQDKYVERKDRKEWSYVGMKGLIPVRDDGTCIPDHFCKCKGGGIATLASERTFDTFMVVERVSENVVIVHI